MLQLGTTSPDAKGGSSGIYQRMEPGTDAAPGPQDYEGSHPCLHRARHAEPVPRIHAAIGCCKEKAHALIRLGTSPLRPRHVPCSDDSV